MSAGSTVTTLSPDRVIYQSEHLVEEPFAHSVGMYRVWTQYEQQENNPAQRQRCLAGSVLVDGIREVIRPCGHCWNCIEGFDY